MTAEEYFKENAKDWMNNGYTGHFSMDKEAFLRYASQSQPTDEDTMYDYISFANYFHKWKEKIQRGTCAIRPDEIFKEWQTSDYRKECKALRDKKITK